MQNNHLKKKSSFYPKQISSFNLHFLIKKKSNKSLVQKQIRNKATIKKEWYKDEAINSPKQKQDRK